MQLEVDNTWRRNRMRFLLAVVLVQCLGCAPVRPEERSVLSDPMMRFDESARDDRAVAHVLENREGSLGAGAIQGGGCGCN